jgi:hypothetical protein
MTRNVMNAVVALALVLSGSAARAQGPCYEVIRVTVGKNQSPPDRYTVRCTIKPGWVERTSGIAGLETTQNIAFKGNDARIQQFVDKVPGIARPDFSKATGFTNWWVRVSPFAEAKLIRSNLTLPDGTHEVHQDPSEEAKALTVFEGINCARTFGD